MNAVAHPSASIIQPQHCAGYHSLPMGRSGPLVPRNGCCSEHDLQCGRPHRCAVGSLRGQAKSADDVAPASLGTAHFVHFRTSALRSLFLRKMVARFTALRFSLFSFCYPSVPGFACGPGGGVRNFDSPTDPSAGHSRTGDSCAGDCSTSYSVVCVLVCCCRV